MLEKSDMIWKSYMFNLKKGTLKFLFNSCLDTLPTQTNLLQRGKSASDLCKLCLQAGTELQGRRQETTNHILNCCKRVLFVIGKYKPHIGFVAEIQAWQWFKPAFRPTVLEIGDLVRLSWVYRQSPRRSSSEKSNEKYIYHPGRRVPQITCLDSYYSNHPVLARVRGIRFILFEIILVLVSIWTIFKVMDLFVKCFLFKTYMPTKKYLRKKAEKLCLIGEIVIESHSFLEYWQNH